MSDAESLRLRAIDELLAAERSFREQAEERLRQLNAVLTEVAYRMGGDRLEALRRQDTTIPKRWTPEDWRRFFLTVILESDKSGWGNASGNGNGNGKAEELQKYRDQVRQLKAENTHLKQELDRLLKQAASLQKPPAAPQKPNGTKSSPPVTTQAIIVQESPAQPSISNPAYAHIPLDTWQMPAVPVTYQDRLLSSGASPRDTQLNLRRKLMALWLLSFTGYPAQIEIAALIAAREGISPGAGSLKRPMVGLGESNLVISQTLSINLETKPSRLVVLRLSEDGKRLCEILGYPNVENEWERLIRLHEGEKQEEHTLAVLLFTVHARLRGWHAEVLPEMQDTPARPDVLIERDDERWYVEVEINADAKDRSAKWINLAELQGGRLAICARTVSDRKALIQDCARWHGVATDLETLIETKIKSAYFEGELWAEQW